MSYFTTVNPAGYINVSAPWRLGEYQKTGMTPEEIREHHKVWGRSIWVSDSTLQILYDIEPKGPEYIPDKSITNSWDKPLSKILKFYLNHNGKLQQQILESNKQKVGKIPRLSFEQSNKNPLHVWVETFELLEHIKSNYFTVETVSNQYISGYFGYNDDIVMQIVLSYFIENNPIKNKQSTTKKKKD